MRSVSVIGIGETKMGSFPEKSIRSMIREAGSKAIEDAGIDKSQIGAVYMGNFNSSYWCGQSHIGALAAEELELTGKPHQRAEAACASAGLAFRQGMLAVACGLYDVVIVGGVEKMTHVSTEAVTYGLAGAADYEYEAGIGATFPSIFAMIANRYMYEYGTTRDQIAAVPVQSHENALLNPDAQMHKSITIEKVKAGFPVAYPLTVYDCSLISDGSAFAVLAATETLKDAGKNKKVIEIIGSGHGGDSLGIAKRENITSFAATKLAANEAYKMAGLTASDVDIAEVHDCFSITQIINTEDLGFFKKGKGSQAVIEGQTAIAGKIPVNTSGGLKAKGHPVGATGISQIFEIVMQLREEAGERQVKNAEIGLAHNLGGTAATCLIHILKRRQ